MAFIYMRCEDEYCIEQWPYRNLEPDVFFYCNESYWLVPSIEDSACTSAQRGET